MRFFVWRGCPAFAILGHLPMRAEDRPSTRGSDETGRWSIALALAVGSAAALAAFLTWLVWMAFFAR